MLSINKYISLCAFPIPIKLKIFIPRGNLGKNPVGDFFDILFKELLFHCYGACLISILGHKAPRRDLLKHKTRN